MGPRGQLPNELVCKHFKLFEVPGAKKPVAECQCCFKYRKAQNTCRQRTHLLEECTKYHEFAFINQPKAQSKINRHFPTLDTARKALLNQKFALAIYATGRAFTAFEDPTWLDFFKELGYKPPSASAIAGPLLDQAYLKVKAQVDIV
jgi:hypothetical protein